MCPRKKDISHADKKKKVADETILEKIICSSSSDLILLSSETSEYLISLAKDGSLKQHQTKGSITKLADELLQKLRGRNYAN